MKIIINFLRLTKLENYTATAVQYFNIASDAEENKIIH